MAGQGPSPTPTALKVLRGENRTERLRPQQPVAPTGDLRPPYELSAEAQSFWDGLLERGVGGWVRPADAHGLAILCEALVRYRRGVRGRQSTVVEKASQEIRLWSRELGLTPGSRSQVVSDRAPATGDAARILSG